MARSISESEWISRLGKVLADDGYSFTGWDGSFAGSRSSVVYECSEHGTVRARAANIITRRSRCAKCAHSRLIDSQRIPVGEAKRKITDRLAASGHSFICWGSMGYSGSSSICISSCVEHGQWEARYCSLIHSSNGCPGCKRETTRRNRTVSEGSLIRKISPFLKGLEFAGWSGEYRGRQTGLRLICHSHGEWNPEVSTLVNQGSGCPGCAEGGGFKRSMPGYIYALTSMCGRHLKIGVTNKLANRIKQLRRSTPFDFSVSGFAMLADGTTAARLERECHATYVKSGFSGFGGATEWMKVTPDLMSWVSQFVLCSSAQAINDIH